MLSKSFRFMVSASYPFPTITIPLIMLAALVVWT
jgi:hypothetical protein